MSMSGRYAFPEDLLNLIGELGAGVSFDKEINHGTQYKVVAGTETVTVNVFSTGKVQVQGKRDSVLKKQIERQQLHRPPAAKRIVRSSARTASNIVPDSTPRVGTDEAGKGEYFGPLIVAGVRVLNAGQSRALQAIGVRDSKDLSTARSTKLAAEILGVLGKENVCESILSPIEYESRRSRAGNVQKLLGELHGEIITKLKDKVQIAVVDSLGSGSRLERHVPRELKVEMRPRAEDDAAVAAASILARARYLEEMRSYSERAGFELPRGATHVLGAGVRVFRERGMEGLAELAKVSFSTTKRVLEAAGGGQRDD